MPDRLTIGVVCTTGIGSERGGRSRNEDNYLVCREGQVRYRKGDSEEVKEAETRGVLLAVADGMGGHRDGDLASTAAVQAMSRLFARPPEEEDSEHVLLDHVLTCHRRLRRRAAEHGPVRMGTTLTAAWVLRGELFWVHVGDSRLYVWRQGQLSRLTRDHTRGEFARRDGRSIGDDGGYLAQNFVYGSRGIGDDNQIRLDPGVDSGRVRLEAGDRLLLCSDGLSGFVPNHRINDVLVHRTEPQAAATTLMERAIAAGSDDNVSVLVVRVDEVVEPTPRMDLPEEEEEDEDPITLVPEDM